jgi:hypothetical protein
MEPKNGYFLNMVKKTPILAFSYFALFSNFPSNKEKSNNILLKDYLFLELPDIWLLIVPRNLVLELS